MAKRYIDADALADKIVNTLKRRDYASDSHTYACFKTFIEILDEAPTADVVEVKCRCSECKHLKIINKEPVYAECERQKLTFLLWQADTREHFCSYGERRTDDGLY